MIDRLIDRVVIPCAAVVFIALLAVQHVAAEREKRKRGIYR